MRYLSLFSGIEAATQAWKSLGWECVGVSEIEPFPCAVLDHHYPDIPNLGDVTKITEEQVKELGQIDLIVFGSPCQNLSVAGNRKGLQGEQSSLFYSAMEIIRYARKNNGLRFALWENVPGSFSSNKGADFSAVVEQMAGLENIGVPKNGWGKEGAAVGSNGLLEWSVLDAQFFGLAQRRKRVFALLDFGDWESRRPVLLEPEGLRGNTPPSRETRESVTANVGASTEGKSWHSVDTQQPPARLAHEIAPCLAASMYKEPPSVMQLSSKNQDDLAVVSLNSKQMGLDTSNVVASTLCANDYKEPQAVAFKERTTALYCGTQNDALRDLSDNLCPTLRAGHGGGSVNPMIVRHESSRVLAFKERAGCAGGGKGFLGKEECAFTLSTVKDQSVLTPKSVVRRLTPIECERLQGFPDDFTKIPYRNKPAEDCPKGVRYKALGNSMAVPVMAWIGRKIEEAVNGNISQE